MKWTANTENEKYQVVLLLGFTAFVSLFILSYFASLIIKEPEGMYAAFGKQSMLRGEVFG